jgi:hypothetical protein
MSDHGGRRSAILGVAVVKRKPVVIAPIVEFRREFEVALQRAAPKLMILWYIRA